MKKKTKDYRTGSMLSADAEEALVSYDNRLTDPNKRWAIALPKEGVIYSRTPARDIRLSVGDGSLMKTFRYTHVNKQFLRRAKKQAIAKDLLFFFLPEGIEPNDLEIED
jgi:hypothetical protein